MRKGYTVTYQMRKKQRQQREIVIQYVLKFVGVVLLAFLLVRFVCFSFTIQGDSMSPTIERGEKHLVNRLIYQIKGPSRYDVVIFKSDDKNGNYYVKRVIGLPGEKVQIKNGRIYVNGKKTKAFSNQKILSAGLAADSAAYSAHCLFYPVKDHSPNLRIHSSRAAHSRAAFSASRKTSRHCARFWKAPHPKVAGHIWQPPP